MKFQKICTWVVVIAFLVTCFAVGIGTIIDSPRKLLNSLTQENQLSAYYSSEEPTLAERIAARPKSLESAINSNLFGKQIALNINMELQSLIGKQLMQFGSDTMVRLRTGHLYDLMPKADLTPQIDEIIELRNTVLKDLPVLFTYAQSTLYDQDMLQEEFKVMDYNWETADYIVKCFREAGIETLDSRDVLNNCGYELEELLLYTDQHWNSFAALIMAGAVAERVQAMGITIDPEKLDLSLFDSQIQEAKLLGKYGQRIGADNTRLDDVTAYWPKYETDFVRTTWENGDVETVSGSFKEAVIRWNKYDAQKGKTYSQKSYQAYGLIEGEDHLVNNSVENGRLLVIKDSFGTSIMSFLSLSVHEVMAVDMRSAPKTVQEYVDEFKPDAVLIIYSQQMLRDYDYKFAEDE